MIIRFPFLYTAYHPEQGKQPEQRVVMGEWGLVEIPDVAAEDAPVSVAWEAVSSLGSRYTMQVRTIDGMCFRPRTTKAQVKYVPAVDGILNQTVANMLSTRPLGFSCFFPPAVVHVSRDTHYSGDSYETIVERADQDTGLRLARHDLENELQRHLDAAADLIVIDGEIWERCPAPELEINFSFSPPRAEVVFRTDRDVRTPNGETCLIPMDLAGNHLGDLLQRMSNSAIIGLGNEDKPWTPDQVNLPTILQVDDDHRDERALRYMIERVSVFASACADKYDYSLSRWPTGYVRAWADLADAIAAVESDQSDGNIQALLHSWSVMNDTMEAAFPAVLDAPFGGERIYRPFARILERSRVEYEVARDCLDYPVTLDQMFYKKPMA